MNELRTSLQNLFMLSCVYIIRNIHNGKIYIGSTYDMRKRYNCHILKLKKNIHYNPHLQNAWNKYGRDGFEFGLLEETLPHKEILLKKEQYWINKFKPFVRSNGYNVLHKAGSRLGAKMSKKAKEKLSISHSGKKLSEEHCKNISKALMGRIVTKETRAKISKAHIGKIFSVEHRKNIGLSSKGRPCSEKTKEINRLYMIGNKLSVGRKLSQSQIETIGMNMMNNKHSAKLTEKDVIKIRKLLKNKTFKQCELAEIYNVDRSTLSYIHRKKSWRTL